MRILLLTDNHTPTGGAENYFFDLKNKLKTIAGNEVYSLGFTPQPETGEDYTTFRAPASNLSRLWWQLFPNRKITRMLAKHCHTWKPDIIHVHNVKYFTPSVLKVLRRYPTLHTVHDFGAVCPSAHNIHQDLSPCDTGFTFKCLREHQHKHTLPIYLAQLLSFLSRRRHTQKNITQLHTVSPILGTYLKQHYPQTVTVIPPFHLETLAVSTQAPHPHHFLYAGHLGSHKGLRHLLAEFALAIKTLPSLKLTIAGDGPEKHSLEKYCGTLNITHAVQFIGWQTQLNEHILAHAATIVPSLWMEAFGLVISESMAHQRAVIGSNRGAIPWLITDNKTGLIFNPQKKGDLAEKMLTLANNPATTQTMGLAGQEKLKHLLDNETALKTLMNTYRNTIRQYANNTQKNRHAR